MRRTISIAYLATICLSSTDAFVPLTKPIPLKQQATALNVAPQSIDTAAHALTTASTFLSTIDSDIASIPDDQFRTVFAGGGLIMLGSILSTVFVGFLIEKTNSYADLVAETYAGQDEDKSFLESLSFEQRKEAEEMVLDFREKKAKKAGTWTEEDERLKHERLKMKEEGAVGEKEEKEKDMFSDYD